MCRKRWHGPWVRRLFDIRRNLGYKESRSGLWLLTWENKRPYSQDRSLGLSFSPDRNSHGALYCLPQTDQTLRGRTGWVTYVPFPFLPSPHPDPVLQQTADKTNISWTSYEKMNPAFFHKQKPCRRIITYQYIYCLNLQKYLNTLLIKISKNFSSNNYP